ncbi:MAG TPA: 16S rRNA (uracil(1498)-N(3))-methyltransferase [Flavobacteriales bacterium]|nr:16S rRNA (uracil(1498)-N(3))-methyltransferase [Flavobacteriales bacterium]HIO15915.1 16S rRNA (uracil(1498)-N(3))-methyltransferase [Flavobacteriales bacterium]
MRSLYVQNLREGCFELPEDEARHASRVLRATVGDTYLLIDGVGGTAEGVFVEVSKRNCLVEVSSITREERPSFGLTMIVSPTKSTDRFEWFLEKAVEIGIERILPVWTERSERKVEKFKRWNKVLVSAMKQSQRSWLPVLHAATTLQEALSTLTEPVIANGFYVAHCMDEFEEGGKKHLLSVLPASQSAIIAIGPEGDFTQDEVKMMLSKGGVEISLGESRLRTETAALSAVAFFEAKQNL